MSEIVSQNDIRLRKLFNAIYEGREGHPHKDFIDYDELIECCEYLISETYGKDFIENWGYDESV